MGALRMQQAGIDPIETSIDRRRPDSTRRRWLASGALGLGLLSLAACAGTTGEQSAEALEQREAESSAAEEGNRR